MQNLVVSVAMVIIIQAVADIPGERALADMFAST